MDVYEAIKKQHDQARDLLTKLRETGPEDAEAREKLFEDLKNDLWAHNKVEEAVFYSRLKEEDATKKDSYEALNEHHVVNGLLEELDAMPKDSEEWGAKLSSLKDVLTHHMEEEEDEIFGEAKETLDDEDEKLMGEEMDQRQKTVRAALRPAS